MRDDRMAPCENCRGRVRPGSVTVDLRRGRVLVVIHCVPAYVCDRCGYKEFTPEVAGKLQRALVQRVKARRTVRVPVVEFDAVA